MYAAPNVNIAIFQICRRIVYFLRILPGFLGQWCIQGVKLLFIPIVGFTSWCTSFSDIGFGTWFIFGMLICYFLHIYSKKLCWYPEEKCYLKNEQSIAEEKKFQANEDGEMRRVPFFYELVRQSYDSFLGKNSTGELESRRTVPLAGGKRLYPIYMDNDASQEQFEELKRAKSKLEALLEKKIIDSDSVKTGFSKNMNQLNKSVLGVKKLAEDGRDFLRNSIHKKLKALSELEETGYKRVSIPGDIKDLSENVRKRSWNYSDDDQRQWDDDKVTTGRDREKSAVTFDDFDHLNRETAEENGGRTDQKWLQSEKQRKYINDSHDNASTGILNTFDKTNSKMRKESIGQKARTDYMQDARSYGNIAPSPINRLKAMEELIHKGKRLPDLLPEMPRNITKGYSAQNLTEHNPSGFAAMNRSHSTPLKTKKRISFDREDEEYKDHQANVDKNAFAQPSYETTKINLTATLNQRSNSTQAGGYVHTDDGPTSHPPNNSFLSSGYASDPRNYNQTTSSNDKKIPEAKQLRQTGSSYPTISNLREYHNTQDGREQNYPQSIPATSYSLQYRSQTDLQTSIQLYKDLLKRFWNRLSKGKMKLQNVEQALQEMNDAEPLRMPPLNQRPAIQYAPRPEQPISKSQYYPQILNSHSESSFRCPRKKYCSAVGSLPTSLESTHLSHKSNPYYSTVHCVPSSTIKCICHKSLCPIKSIYDFKCPPVSNSRLRSSSYSRRKKKSNRYCPEVQYPFGLSA